jgi:protein TonB
MMADFILMNRPVQWIVIGLGHLLIISLMLQTTPQATPAAHEVIQARLIRSQQPLAVTANESQPLPMQKLPSKPQAARQQFKPVTISAAAQQLEPAPAALAKPTAELPVDMPRAAVAAASASAGPLTPPIFNAAYLENPSPAYPSASRRFGETGHVLLRVFVSAVGRAERIELKTSSGFDRLDDAARMAVTRWRFIPARRGEEAIAAWVLVPISFAM